MPKKIEISWTNHISVASSPHIPLNDLPYAERSEIAKHATDTALRSAGYVPATRPADRNHAAPRHATTRIAKQSPQRYNEENSPSPSGDE